MKHAPTRRIFVYCDDPGHGKRVAVTNFIPLWDEDTLTDDPHVGRWTEHHTSRNRATAGSGTTLAGDSPLSGRGMFPIDRSAEYRSRYELRCRKCKDRPVQAVEPRLFAALTAFWNAGHTELPLRLLRDGLTRTKRA